jgi:hypothetical protein
MGPNPARIDITPFSEGGFELVSVAALSDVRETPRGWAQPNLFTVMAGFLAVFPWPGVAKRSCFTSKLLQVFSGS